MVAVPCFLNIQTSLVCCAYSSIFKTLPLFQNNANSFLLLGTKKNIKNPEIKKPTLGFSDDEDTETKNNPISRTETGKLC